jgi:hypothetical protein
MYRPGFEGSPYSTAVELPDGLVVHLMFAGSVYANAFGSGSAAFTRPNNPKKDAAEAAIKTLRSNRVRVMSVSFLFLPTRRPI